MSLVYILCRVLARLRVEPLKVLDNWAVQGDPESVSSLYFLQKMILKEGFRDAVRDVRSR